MRKIALNNQTELKVHNIRGFLKKRVTKFGTGAKVDCPKEFLDKEVYLVILDGTEKAA